VKQGWPSATALGVTLRGTVQIVRRKPADPLPSSVRLDVEALGHGSSTYALIVEPWGESYDITESNPAVVIFVATGQADPAIGISHGPDYVMVYANDGISDCRVEDREGNPLTAR
jgi:hypothetical protein